MTLDITEEETRSPHLTRPERFAVIDIGSNTVRLVLFEKAPGRLVSVLNEKVSVGLGQFGEGGHVPKERIEGLFAALSRFMSLCKGHQVSHVRAFATAALRDAQNGPSIRKDVETKFDLNIKLLSGDEEAMFAGRGVLSSFPHAEGVVGDLGGGSLELVVVRAGSCHEAVSLPFGILRSASAHLSGQLPEILGAQLRRVGFIGDVVGQPFYLVGGSWRSLVKAYAETKGDRLEMLQAFEPGEDFLTFCKDIAKQNSSDLNFRKVSSSRRQHLPVAANLLGIVADVVKPSTFITSASGVREGVAHEERGWLFPNDLKMILTDISTNRSRLRPATSLHEQWLGYLDIADHCRMAVQLAMAYSDAGWRKHPDLRGMHTGQEILHAELPGLTRFDRYFAANAMYCRYEGLNNDNPFAHADVLHSDDQELSVAVGLSLRLAWYLAGGAGHMIVHAKLETNAGRLLLVMAEGQGHLVNEGVVKRLAQLARHLNLEPDVVSNQG